MTRIRLLAAVTLLCLAAVPVSAQEEPPVCPETRPPYVFLLLDTSGSLNLSSRCTQEQYDVGDCPVLCPTGDCFVPLQGDDPASRFHMIKEALTAALADEAAGGNGDIHFGFATFNQDQLRARAKHWIYAAQNDGPSLVGGTPYPAAGGPEVFGYLWGCDTGSGDHEIGCIASKPADLNDPWEIARVQRLPKAGTRFNQNVTFYIRQSPNVYRVIYTPVSGAVPGSSTIQVNVSVDRCANASCSSRVFIGQQVVTWSRVDEFLSWDNGDLGPSRTNPALSYFSQSAAADASAANTCSGWDPNTDTTSDRYNGYNLRWPTNSSDPRGAHFTVGDVIPLDWTNDHLADVQERLAPNLVYNPSALPDFRIASYLQNLPFGAETFLRLKDENLRPLIATGPTPLGNALRSFHIWYAGCPQGNCPANAGWQGIAAAQDPDWLCRRKYLVVLTDEGVESCGVSPCDTVSSLSEYGVQTFAVGLGSDPGTSGSQLNCMASNGGTQAPFRPWTLPELYTTLQEIFAAAKAP